MSRQAIYEVAGDPTNGASADLDTCELRGAGFSELCSVWRRPGLRPDAPSRLLPARRREPELSLQRLAVHRPVGERAARRLRRSLAAAAHPGTRLEFAHLVHAELV